MAAPPKRKAIRKKLPKKLCMTCPSQKPKSVSGFYISKNPFHTDGYLPICKECIHRLCYIPETNQIDVEQLKNVLRQCDRPFVPLVLEGVIREFDGEHENDPTANRSPIIGKYFRSISSLPQYSRKSWFDGSNDPGQKTVEHRIRDIEVVNTSSDPIHHDDDEPIYASDAGDFDVTDEMIRLFGEGLTRSEYKAMWDKYQFLKESYPDITNLHVEALATYVRLKVREEAATIQGNVQEADKWSQMATKAADRAKINPSQLTQHDLQGGLNSFSELFQVIEQSEDVIPILPQFKFRPNDAIDFNIWCIINYLRDLEGKPLCSYEDVYKFYDKRKAEYIEQYGDPYGIFTNDPSENNRDGIKKFITLPDDYYEDEESSSKEGGSVSEEII